MSASPSDFYKYIAGSFLDSYLNDHTVDDLIERVLNETCHEVSEDGFLLETQFFLKDAQDKYRVKKNILEAQQYYRKEKRKHDVSRLREEEKHALNEQDLLKVIMQMKEYKNLIKT